MTRHFLKTKIWFKNSKSGWFPPDIPVSITNKTDSHDIAEKILKVALNNIVLASLMLLKGEAANTNLIVWFEATKDRVHDLFIDGNTLTFTQQIVPHKERKKITVHPFL